ncbi:stage 0 sporulation family protein [Planctomycetota bacterium]
MTKSSETKSKQTRNKKYMLVRFGRMGALGLFEHHEKTIPKVHTRVVIKTGRGLELGHLVGRLTCYRSGQFRLSEEQIRDYFENSNPDFAHNQAGKFIRYATAADISEERHLWKIAKEEMESCKHFVKEMNLPMKIVDAEHVFGGERIIFYFMSDGRVDFRELVKRIAQEYQTRIEMRQIGSRDEAKLLGDVESCGQQCCCQRFLKHLKPVNMRMAKMQKATLDPAKISGYCGRLKCCLRYEDKAYTDLKKLLPKKNTRVKTKQGVGKVIDTQILTQLVMVEYEGGERSAVDIEEIEILPPSAVKEEKQNNTPNNNKKNRNNNR